MTKIIRVRVDSAVLAKLKSRAKANRRTVMAEGGVIIENALTTDCGEYKSPSIPVYLSPTTVPPKEIPTPSWPTGPEITCAVSCESNPTGASTATSGTENASGTTGTGIADTERLTVEGIEPNQGL